MSKRATTRLRILSHTCPHCGGTAFYAADQGAIDMLDSMSRQAEAKQHVDRGAQLLLQGRYAEAETELRRGIEINPMNATAHGNMGGIFLRQGQPENAIPWLERALELNPRLEGVPQALAQARAMARRQTASKKKWWEFWK